MDKIEIELAQNGLIVRQSGPSLADVDSAFESLAANPTAFAEAVEDLAGPRAILFATLDQLIEWLRATLVSDDEG